MPSSKLEIAKGGFRKRMDIIKSTLTLVKGKLSNQEYGHVKRLMADGTERDLVFMQGLATGMELAALDKKSTLTIIDVLNGALQRANKGEYPSLKRSDLEKIDAVMKSKFPFGARRKILSILARGDSVMFDGLIEMLKKAA